MIDRRTKEGYKLRVLIDAHKKAVATSQDEWVREWINGPKDAPYQTLMGWVCYLEQCVVKESEVYFGRKAS